MQQACSRGFVLALDGDDAHKWNGGFDMDQQQNSDRLVAGTRQSRPPGARCLLRGFTLVELLVVIAIIGILVALLLLAI